MDSNNQLPEIKNAGHISPRLTAALAKEFTPDVVVGKIKELLEATHLTKGGQKIADNRAREAGLKLLLAYQIGMPVQRQEIVNVNLDGDAAIEEQMRKSPQLRRAMIARLQAMDGGDSSPVIDVPAVPVEIPGVPMERPPLAAKEPDQVEPAQEAKEPINENPQNVKGGGLSALTGLLRKVKEK